MADVTCAKFSMGDWGSWLQVYTAFSVFKDWDEVKKRTAFPFYLEEPAKSIYNGLSEEIQADWQQICAHMENAFKRDTDDEETVFYQRRQAEGETVATYAAVLKAMGQRAFPEHNVVTREKLVLKQFFKGLKPTVAQETIKRNPKDLNGAVTAAQEAIRIQAMLEEMKPPGAKQMCSAVNDNDGEIEQLRQQVLELTKLVQQLGEKPAAQGIGGSSCDDKRDERTKKERRGQRCFECGGRGHFARECANRTRENKQPGNDKNQRC